MPKMHELDMDDAIAKIKADRNAALGSHEKAKYILDCILQFMQAIEDDVAVEEWFIQNVGFMAYTKVGRKFIKKTDTEKELEKDGGELEEGYLITRGSRGVLMAMMGEMLNAMAEREAEDMQKNSPMLKMLDMLGDKPKEFDAKVNEAAVDLAKVMVIQELADRIGCQTKVGAINNKTQAVKIFPDKE